MAETIRELAARTLYQETMGEAAILPWPASNAATYRRLADAVLTIVAEHLPVDDWDFDSEIRP